jgi:hypothetical protein
MQPGPENVSFSEQVYVGYKDNESQYETKVRYGIVVSWQVIPDEQPTGPYGEGPLQTSYVLYAVVRCTDGVYRTPVVSSLRYAGREVNRG